MKSVLTISALLVAFLQLVVSSPRVFVTLCEKPESVVGCNPGTFSVTDVTSSVRAKELLLALKFTASRSSISDAATQGGSFLSTHSDKIISMSRALGSSTAASLPSSSTGMQTVSVLTTVLNLNLEEVGWDTMSHITARESTLLVDNDVFFAMGLAEAEAAFDRLKDTYTNAADMIFSNRWEHAEEDMTSLLKFQDFRSRILIAENRGNRVYQALDGLHNQVLALDEHYSHLHYVKFGEYPAYRPKLFSHRSDFGDLFRYIDRDRSPSKSCWEVSAEEAEYLSRSDERCSVYASLLTEKDHTSGEMIAKETTVAHATWTDYRDQIRVIRFMMLELDFLPSSVGSTSIISYPSYYGMFGSYDDMYNLQSKTQNMVITETTNSICDMSLLDNIRPFEMLTHQRAMIANFLSTSGDEWAKYFSWTNSGTYNNQWMIFDHKKIGQKLTKAAGLFTVLEQYPGGIVYKDLTFRLFSQGYWVSYNKPFFPEVFNAMGFDRAVDAHGSYYSYDKNPRANIFRREIKKAQDQGTSTSFDWIKKLIRMNKWQTDPLSRGIASFAIAGRYDLIPHPQRDLAEMPCSGLGFIPKWGIHGATDAKIITSKTSDVMYAVAGIPSEDQPVFDWNEPYVAAKKYSHVGVPEKVFEWDEFLFV